MRYSIVNYDQLDKTIFRLEAEFYNSSSLANINCYTGQEIINFVQYGTSKELNEDNQGFPTLRLNEFESFFIKQPQKYCNKIDANIYKALSLKKGDVLICRTNGNPKLVGKSAIVPKDYNYAFASYLFRVRTKQDKILPTTLVAYLNCSIGRAEIEKYLMVSNQANFSPAKFREIQIPVLGNDIQTWIEKTVYLAFEKLELANFIYSKTNNLLLQELGLKDWKPKHSLSFVRNYNEAKQVERIDAEYFQPKYDELAKVIKKYKGGRDTLGNLVSIKKCIEVGSGEYRDKGIPFIRVSNLSPFELTEEKYISEKQYSELMQHQPKQGEILFSKDATPGIAYHLNDKPLKMIPSGGILRLKLKDNQINEDYLTLVLNSMIVKEQINRDVGGSVILHWRPDQVKETLIPLLSKDKQNKIQQKISESFNLRKESKRLLECAKRAVEMAIEKDEKTAMKWISEQTEINKGVNNV